MKSSSRWKQMLALVLLAVAASFLGTGAAPALAPPAAASPCDSLYWEGMPVFPRIYVCAFPGAYQDSSLVDTRRCVGSFMAPLADSIVMRPRTVTLRFRRDRRAEARSDFGGYRIYRAVNYPDTSYMMLIRRYSRQVGDERTWNFSVLDGAPCIPDTGRNRSYCWDDPALTDRINPNYMQYVCRGEVVHDSVVTFVDPDSNGNYVKVCRLRNPQEGLDGVCVSRYDSVFVLRAPPGPHDGFRTWYSVTHEQKNRSLDGNYADMFVPDTTGRISTRCIGAASPDTCPNLNSKDLNITSEPVEPTGGPTRNTERVVVVPNPFRARVPWDQRPANEVHFVNLPRAALIRIYTVAGDLVAELTHDDPVRDFERWNLKNQRGQDVASGIYLYRVESTVSGRGFSFQDRFIVIR